MSHGTYINLYMILKRQTTLSLAIEYLILSYFDMWTMNIDGPPWDWSSELIRSYETASWKYASLTRVRPSAWAAVKFVSVSNIKYLSRNSTLSYCSNKFTTFFFRSIYSNFDAYKHYVDLYIYFKSHKSYLYILVRLIFASLSVRFIRYTVIKYINIHVHINYNNKYVITVLNSSTQCWQSSVECPGICWLQFRLREWWPVVFQFSFCMQINSLL